LAFKPYTAGPWQPPLQYVAPEVVSDQPGTSFSHVFAFAFIFAELVLNQPLLAYRVLNECDTSQNPSDALSSNHQFVYTFLSECLRPAPRQRPPFASIVAPPEGQNHSCFGRRGQGRPVPRGVD
jgi:serine/threonine protein kinase